MKILVIGSGGREHALVWKMNQSPLVTKMYAAPGNAGISEIAECVDIKADDIDQLKQFALEKKIDLTVVGPELPLVKGIVDEFEASDLLVFGPSKEAAKLEGSKEFSKTLMKKVGIPTADFKAFKDVNDAKQYIVEKEPPFVIKADGLAAGKGVIIAESCEEGIKVVNQMIVENLFGESGKVVVIEEFLKGDELSVLLLTDGKNIIPLASSQDHKRAFDYDRGPNTGGMGAYSPCPIVTDDELKGIVNIAAKPLIDELAARGTPYKGLLYVGIIMTDKGPSILEYNVRFGDPEAQAVLPRLKTDLVQVMLEIAKGELTTETLEWDKRACLCVVMASGGYPTQYESGQLITGLGDVTDKDVMVFHAGTQKNKDEFETSGGRVLAVSALGNTLKDAHGAAYDAIEKIKFSGGFFRKDIGKRVFEQSEV